MMRCGVASYGADAYFCATTTQGWPGIMDYAKDGFVIDMAGNAYKLAIDSIIYPTELNDKSNAFGALILNPVSARASSVSFNVSINGHAWERLTFTKNGSGNYNVINYIGDKYNLVQTNSGKYGPEFDFSDRTKEVLIKDVVVK